MPDYTAGATAAARGPDLKNGENLHGFVKGGYLDVLVTISTALPKSYSLPRM
jgi:hypothetical protein